MNTAGPTRKKKKVNMMVDINPVIIRTDFICAVILMC